MNWLFGSALKTTMVTPERALAGRDALRVHRPDDPHRPRHPAAGPLARGHRGPLRGDGLFLGRGAHLLEDPRRRHDRRRLPGWVHALPHLRGDVHRPDRAHRDRDGRVRPHRRLGRRPAAHLLGVARPDAGVPAGQRRRHPVPLGDLHHDARAGARRTQHPRRVPAAADPSPASARSPPRSGPPTTPARSTTPRATTSSTSTRTRPATAAWAARASPARARPAPDPRVPLAARSASGRDARPRCTGG